MLEVSLDSVGRAFIYLGIPFVLMIFYFQWRWARVCDKNIQLLVVEQGGGGSFQLAPKTGGSVAIKNPTTGIVRVWAINELSTIDVLYPGVGFVPGFMQKQIRMAIVNEGDWEPLLNRSPHMQKVASPDIVKGLEAIVKRLEKKADGVAKDETADSKTVKSITELLDGISTAPTREMIASPAVLGNLITERITELAVTVAKDIMNPLAEAIKKMGRQVNPLVVYIGLGLIVIMLAFMIYTLLPVLESMEGMVEGMDIIKQALGVK